MATVTRGTKTVGGGTNFSGGKILHTEVDTDFNTIYTDYNGNITNVNVAAGAALDPDKIDDYSATAAEMATETSPGVTGGTSAPTTLSAEIERIRYKLKQIGTGTSTVRLDGTAATDLVSWFDLPQTGPNLIRNGNFAIGLESSLPVGWSNVNTATIALTTTGVTEGHSTARALRVTAAGGALEGISQTLVGLKANTKYLIGCRVKVNAGGDTVRLLTTGADNAVASFDDLALDTSSTTYTTLAGVIITDATPTNIVVQILAVVDTDSFDVTHVWVRECATDKLPMSNTSWAYNEVTTGGVAIASGVLTDTGLTVSVVCPGPGYIIEVDSAIDLTDTGANDASAVLELRQNGTGVRTSNCFVKPASGTTYATGHLTYINRSPTPGTTYTYTVFVAGIGSAISMNHSVTAAGESPIASWIRCRAVLESGGH